MHKATEGVLRNLFQAVKRWFQSSFQNILENIFPSDNKKCLLLNIFAEEKSIFKGPNRNKINDDIAIELTL